MIEDCAFKCLACSTQMSMGHVIDVNSIAQYTDMGISNLCKEIPQKAYQMQDHIFFLTKTSLSGSSSQGAAMLNNLKDAHILPSKEHVCENRPIRIQHSVYMSWTAICNISWCFFLLVNISSMLCSRYNSWLQLSFSYPFTHCLISK